MRNKSLEITQQDQSTFPIVDGPFPPKDNFEFFKTHIKFCSGTQVYFYKFKIINPFSSFNGGIKPTNNSQVVIDSPESVNLVRPPTNIIRIINDNNEINQIFNSLFK